MRFRRDLLPNPGSAAGALRKNRGSVRRQLRVDLLLRSRQRLSSEIPPGKTIIPFATGVGDERRCYPWNRPAIYRMPRIHASLRALLSNLIDYAGLFPPASLPLGSVIENYEQILASPESWLLNRLVLPGARLKEVRLQEHWRVTLVVDSEPGPLPRQVETLETKLPHKLSLPTYCEAPIEQIGDGYAKLRVGSEPLKLV